MTLLQTELMRSLQSPTERPKIRLLAFIEGSTVNGPAKNFLNFCRTARVMNSGPLLETSLVMFERSPQNVTPVPTNELREASQRQGIPVHVVRERHAFDPLVWPQLRGILKRVSPHVIQTHMFKSHFLIRASGAYKHHIWIAFHHGYTRSRFRHDLLAHLDRWSLRAPAQVVTVSDAFAHLLISRGVRPEQIKVLHNAVDADWIEPKCVSESRRAAKAALGYGPEKLVLAVGRLSREKGFSDLVNAVAYLKQVKSSLKFRGVILGEGLERQNLTQAIQKKHLEKDLLLIGHISDVRPYYRAADILVIPSLSEGSPNVLLEAMAAGLPVVATHVGGIPEIASDEQTALLVPPRNPRALATGIDRLLSDSALADSLAARARELVVTLHTPMVRAQALLSMYEQLYQVNSYSEF
jgi:glycosyltransferase involved in cell wall biosynthesis